MFKRIIVFMLPMATLLPWSPAAAEPDSTGGGVPSASTPTLVPQDADMLSKDVLVIWAESQLDADETPGSTPLTCPAGEVCPSDDSQYLAVVNHKEGKGNPCTAGTTGCSSLGHKYYTCSAAATRNMVDTWISVDKGELWFENKYDLNPSLGLEGIQKISNLLNNQWGEQGSWKPKAPSSAKNYQAGIMTDIALSQPVIQNVQTSYLPYFNGKSLTHYNISYGYNRPEKTVGVAEEWDPVWTFGSLPAGYGGENPYGTHQNVSRVAGYNAVKYSPNGKYVL